MAALGARTAANAKSKLVDPSRPFVLGLSKASQSYNFRVSATQSPSRRIDRANSRNFSGSSTGSGRKVLILSRQASLFNKIGDYFSSLFLQANCRAAL
jgi:hypothetical protein